MSETSDTQPRVTITLTEAALKRLLEDQPEAKVKITQGVIQNYANANLSKLVLNSEEIRGLTSQIQQQLQLGILQEFGQCLHPKGLGEQTKKRIKETVAKEVQNQLDVILSPVGLNIEILVTDRLLKEIDKLLDPIIKDKLNQSVKNLLEEKLKGILDELGR